MKFRTNRERAERKRLKAQSLLEKNNGKRYPILFHRTPSYAEIVSSVKTKIPYRCIRNAHKRLGVEALYILPRFIKAI